MRVLLTGGSGFIAAHVLDILLDHGHSVVTTVRSTEKANKIAESHKQFGKDKLDFALVEDIAQPGAFDKAVVSDPSFEAVIHCASPFHLNVTDVQKDLLDPAIIGTTGILKAVKKGAPSVKRVVITSSFASIINASKGPRPGYTYSEKDWNPVTQEDAEKGDPATGYRASKTLAERAAWDFVEKEKPSFSLATMCPPLVLGPVVHYLNSLDAVNTSNQRTRDCMLGKWKDEIPGTGIFIWVDVRDLALFHVLAAEKEEAANKRFFITAGTFTNGQIADVVKKNYPELKDVPDGSIKNGGFPAEGLYEVDNSRASELLGAKWRSFDTCIVDTVKSLRAVGA